MSEQLLSQTPKRSRWLWPLLIGVWIVIIGLQLFAPKTPALSYTEFKDKVRAGQVAEVTVSRETIVGREKKAGDEKEGKGFTVVRVEDEDLLRDLSQAGVKVQGVKESSFLRDLFAWVGPLLLLGLFWIWFLPRLGKRAGGGLFSVGQSKAKIYVEQNIGVTFSDVAGVDEAKQELTEVIEFLRHPERFAKIGGRLPKGILLVGPPGTGKTLLARAVAGEAGVPFFSISGSEFVEMFVGVGAARVRDLFQQARERAPCIIFIDELDALGKARGMGPMSHEEREQTLNQLLVELDGFDPRVGVILMAATNRPEILDPALLRAGRFDRHVLVDRPDKGGRLAILRIHAQKVQLGADVDLEVIAAMTPGMVGADLANLINEAALLAVRRGKERVGTAELQEAVERVIAGLEKRNRVLNPAERARVAHHEVGHALVALSLPNGGAVHKISIIPRGIAALGYTLQLPTEDRFLLTEDELRDKIATLLGGRVAEELIYGNTSTGSADDLVKATDLARNMVRAYGMSDSLGPVSYDRRRPNLMEALGGGDSGREFSEETWRTIDSEVRDLVDGQHARAVAILQGRIGLLRRAAQDLLTREVLSGDELRAMIAGEEGGRDATDAPDSTHPASPAHVSS
jgi:cell division protease FtsH